MAFEMERDITVHRYSRAVLTMEIRRLLLALNVPADSGKAATIPVDKWAIPIVYAAVSSITTLLA